MADQGNSGTGDVGPEWGQNFEQCLQLLRGPGDERRFVGLLLVTRLLPRGSDDAVRRVLDALGTQFLHRLLLPLRRSTQALCSLPAEAVAHQVTSCGLALAILAAACRLPDFAAGPDVREFLPVLVQVVQCGRVSCILEPGTAEAAGGVPAAAAAAAAVDAADTDAADADAASDALECLVGAAAAAPQLTFAALEHCPLLEALAACLTAAAAALTSVPPSATAVRGIPSSSTPAAPTVTVEAQKHHAVLLAAALLERLLAGGGGGGDTVDGGRGGGRAVAALAEHPAAAARIMAALSALVGNPRLRLPASPPAATSPGSSSSSLQSPTPPQQQQQQQQQQASDPSASRSSARQDAGGAAQLQLEALHLLLLMLRTCQEPAAAAAVRELVRLDEQTAWSAAVRRGLGWLLRSRAPAALRHSALQLAALVVELVGERWLLGSPAATPGTAAAPSWTASTSVAREREQEQPGSFLVLLLETLKIEAGLLLLQDALNPDRQVPALDSHRSYALGQAGPTPVPSQRLLDELAARAKQRQAAEAAAVKAAVDAAAGAGPAAAAPPPLPPQGAAAVTDAASTAAVMDVEEEDGLSSAAAASGAMPAAAAAAPTIPAGHRALVLLPACFKLLEGTVEAVAADAAAADGHMEVEGLGEGAAAAARLTSPPPQPLLSEAVMQKLMGGLDDISCTLLQFFEAATAPQPQPQEQVLRQPQPQLTGGAAEAPSAPPSMATAATAAGGGAVLLGAARLLGRYLAEAPDAVRSGRVLRVLPQVMAVRGADAVADRLGGAAGGDLDLDLDLDRFAMPFLLPGLLQATGPGADGRADTTRALRASPAALDACVSYMAHCVVCAVAVAPHAERSLAAAAAATIGGGGGSGDAAVAALARSERGMADVSMLLLNLLEPSVLGSLAVGRGAAEEVGPAEAGAAASAAWRVLRRCQGGGAAGEMQTAAEAVAKAEAEAKACLPPLLAQLLPVCWLVQRWAAARRGALRGLLSLDPLMLPGHGGGDASTGVSQLSGSQLGTRPLLCTACLAAVILTTTMSWLAAATAATAETQQVAATATTTTAAAAAASVILPPAVIEGVGAVALAGAAAGASLQAAQMFDTAAASSSSLYCGDGRPRLPLTPAGLAEDFPGDGEECWERLLGACAQMVEMSGAVRRLAAVPSGAVADGASWLLRLAEARARGDPAAVELLSSEVNLALLLQLVAGSGQGIG